MFLPDANVQVKLAGTQAEAERTVFGCGAAPCFTLVVNGARHASADAFLRTAKPARHVFSLAGTTNNRIVVPGLVAGSRPGDAFAVGRHKIGTLADLSDWDELDAVLMADSFDKLADALAEFDRTAS